MVKYLNVDKNGRIVLPKEFRSKLRDRVVLAIVRGDILTITPVRRKNLTSFFDLVEVDIPPEAFSDYNRLKNALLAG